MVKRAFFVVFGLLAFCFPLLAQQTSILEQTISLEQLALYRPDILGAMDGSALLDGLRMLTLSGGQWPGSSELGRMGTAPVDISPDDSVTLAEIVVRGEAVKDSRPDGKDSSTQVMNSPLHPISYGGEVGFRYGHASGKFGGDDFLSYVTGAVGNDKFQITVGAGYQESSWRRH